MFTVLDVSRWQGRIDWDTVKASGRVHGVMLRALGSRSGTPYIDPMFETNYSACIRLGIPVGVYYYSCAVTAPQRDAELALLHDALRGKRLQLPAAIDVEDARLRALTPDALSALVAGAARQLEPLGPVRHGIHLHPFCRYGPAHGHAGPLRPLAGGLPGQTPGPQARDVAVHQQGQGTRHLRPRGPEPHRKGLSRPAPPGGARPYHLIKERSFP